MYNWLSLSTSSILKVSPNQNCISRSMTVYAKLGGSSFFPPNNMNVCFLAIFGIFLEGVAEHYFFFLLCT